MTKQSEKQGPAFESRLNHIRVSVWRNMTEGKAWYNVTFTRRFKDGDEWRDSTTFNGLADLAILREALEQARDFIRAEEQSAQLDGSC